MIYLISDSIGCKRNGVKYEDTYPSLLRQETDNMVVKSYYSLTLHKTIDWLTGVHIERTDKIIIQAGIVDCITQSIPPSQIRELILNNRVADKYMLQTYIIGLVYYGPENENTKHYNKVFSDIYGDRYIDTSSIENSHTIEDGIHLTKAGHLEMYNIIRRANLW